MRCGNCQVLTKGRTMKSSVVLCALLCLVFATGLAQVPDPPDPAIIRSCLDTNCNNMWKAQGGSTTYDCGVDCEGGCYYCQGAVNRNHCRLHEGPNNGCIYNVILQQVECGHRFRVPCDVKPTGGCECNTDPNVPSVPAGPCIVTRCINPAP